MPSRQLDEEAIFHVARGISDPVLRSTYLDQVCAGDQPLRERVEALLTVHEQEQEFLNSAPQPALTTDRPALSEGPGKSIGRYKLLQQIGEGGFGVVYMAEQERPIRRKVALKVIKPGMDTHAVVARFEAERQALALMDHSNIARVLDGGATDSDRPYFVMELVKGVPLTEYCDQNQLSTEDRLQLFITVCQAVQHAHQKGIIHRDLKPSNILVTLHDGEPVVKVIDFGVAKAINQTLTEKTLFTTYGQMVGTPAYMSPEQAEMSGLDVDTRSDIYSLGVLLYELLTGTTPLESDRLRTAGYAEIQRLIREEEPPKPSTRLSTSGEKLTSIAKHRSIAPDRLQRLIRGDLDWIVMKCLEKDRARRYETAIGLARDVERYFQGEPVEACPASSLYRLQKFVAKNRGAVASMCAVSLALLIGLGTAGWALARVWAVASQLRATLDREKDTANQLRAALTNFHRELEMNILDAALGGKPDQAKFLLAEAKVAGVPEVSVVWLTALVALSEGRAKDCITSLENLRASGSPLSVAAHTTLATAYMEDGQLSEYVTALDQLRQRKPVDDADYVLFGEARWLADETGVGIELLKEGLRRRDTPVLRAICARAMMISALAEADKEHANQLAKEAIENITVAEIMSGDLPLVGDISVLVHHGALRLDSGDERETHQRRSLEAAKLPVGSALGALYRAELHHRLGNVSEARHFYEESTRRGDMYAYFLAAFLFEHFPETGLEEFVKVRLPRANGLGAMGAKAFLLALTPDRQKDAIELADRVANEYRDYDTRIDALCASLLAGDQEVTTKARKLKPTCYANFHEFDRMLDHLAGTYSLTELESIATTSMGRHVHYYVIGVKLLASGDRQRASEYFKRSSETPHLFTSYPLYSRALLKQLERDPTWPHWLPAGSTHPIESDAVQETQKSGDADNDHSN